MGTPMNDDPRGSSLTMQGVPRWAALIAWDEAEETATLAEVREAARQVWLTRTPPQPLYVYEVESSKPLCLARGLNQHVAIIADTSETHGVGVRRTFGDWTGLSITLTRREDR